MRRTILATTAAIAACLALSASAAAAPRLYVPQYASGPPEVFAAFDRAPDGSLSPTPGSPYPVGGMPPGGPGGLYAGGFAPDGERAAASFLFTGGVQGIAVSADGTMTRSGAPIPTPSATDLAVSPDGRFVYVPTRTFGGQTAVGILGYAFGADGSLTPLPDSPYSPGEVEDIVVSPDGRFLFAQIGSAIRRFAIGADGALTPLGDTPLPGALYLDVSPDGRFVFATVERVDTDAVVSFSVDNAGNLTQNGDPLSVGEQSPGFLAVAPDGRHLYIPEANNDVIITAAIAGDGTLSAAGSTPVMDIASAAASPDGRFLYVWDRLVIRTAPIGPDGTPGALLPGSVPLDVSTPSRMLFQPQPTPRAKFKVKRAAPKKPTRFNAGASERATRYDWDFGDGTAAEDAGPKPSHRYKKAGKYDVTLTVYDESGCGPQQIYTGRSTSCPGGNDATATRKADTLPVLRKLKVKPRRFAAGARAKVAYKLSEKAKVKLKIERKRGKRYAGIVKFNDNGKKGRNVAALTANLTPGTYRVTAVAKDKAGGKSKRAKAPFAVGR